MRFNKQNDGPIGRLSFGNEPLPRNYAGPNAGDMGSAAPVKVQGSMGHQTYRVNHDYAFNYNGQHMVPRG